MGRVAGPDDPQWLDLDIDYALAFQRAKAECCPSCGTRKAEWDADRYAYVAEQYQCPGCELLEMERANIPASARGVHTFLIRAEPEPEYSAED